ncbi:MAG: DEAD/DEAH box helicase [Chloroflexi bacterium]|nr:DEAD/DEAH box helicase [Chloroflexota bacterium]
MDSDPRFGEIETPAEARDGLADDQQAALIQPENPLPPVNLADLPAPLRAAAARAGWSELMPVQSRAIPYLLASRDLMIQARTGSGKTGAFVLPILHRIDPARATCQALVLLPTRELARQVAGEAGLLGGEMGVRVAAVYGGVGYGPQIEAFRAGAHLVVGTPGRVLDHLLKRTLTLDDLQVLVFDEADRMLSMGFYPDMREVQRYLPSRLINGYMFSATLPAHVLRLARQFLRQPEFLSLSRDHVHVTDTEHVYYIVPGMDKDRSLIRILEVENPASALIFCNTRARAHYLAVVLQRYGYDADELSADLAQKDRDRVLGRVREGALRFLVATDVAARGLDIPELSHVILYEPPEDSEAYIHRAGRTGRALVAGIEKFDLDRIAKRYGIDMQEQALPTDGEVQQIVSERVTALLEARRRTRDQLQAERSQRFVPLARELAQDEEELGLIAMLLDDYYQQSLHAALPGPALRATRQAEPARPARRAPDRQPRRSSRRGSQRR